MKNHALGVDKVSKQGFKIHIAPIPFNYAHWLQTLASQLAVNVFIGDVRDGLPLQAIQQLKTKNILTIAIDEPSDYRKACDFCFYPPHAQLEQLDWSGFEGQIKQGLEYVLLRPEFYQNHQKKTNNPANLLIMMGGTDPERLTLPIVNQLLQRKTAMHFKVVIRADHPDFNEISHKPVRIYSSINDMAEFLTAIDFAVISFGISAYELVAMKIPALHICLDTDHWQSSEFFEKNRLATRVMKRDLNHIGSDIKTHANVNAIIKENAIANTILQEV